MSRGADPDAGTDWFDAIPKVELHVHIEGSIPAPAMWELMTKYGGDPRVQSLADLEQRFCYTSFAHFIETWIWKNGYLRELDDFTFMAEAVARHSAAQKIRYVEAFYSPPDFARRGLGVGEITRALRAGLDRVPNIRVRLVADLVRDSGSERTARTLEEVAEVRDLDVAKARVPLEMCPMSNVRTAVVPSLDAHPIRDYVRRGVLVTVNSDDPAMFQTSLAGEYRALRQVLGFTRAEILQLIDNAVEASWASAEDKDALRRELRADPAWHAS